MPVGDKMPGDDALEYRRSIVASLRAQRLTQSEIAERLAELDPPILVSHVTVNKDLKVLRQRWTRKLLETTGEWLADELLVLEELEKRAWSLGKLNLVLQIMERRSRMLGLDRGSERHFAIDLTKLSNEQLSRLARGEDLLEVLAAAQNKEPSEGEDG